MDLARRTIPALMALWLFSCGTGTTNSGTAGDRRTWTMARLDSAILASPEDASLFAERARLNRSNDSLRAAINDWKRAILLDSTNMAWRIALGDLYYSRLDLDQAEAQFTKAISLAPDSTEPRLKLAELRLMQGRTVEAMAEANNALRIDDQNARGYFLKGWIHRVAGDTALAISSYRTATERDPGFYDAYLALANILAVQEDQLALSYFNSAVDLRPHSVEARYARGMYGQEHGMDSVALADYAHIKAIDPKNPTAWYNTGYILLEHQDRFADARREFSGAIIRMPTYAQAYFNRGLTYELEGLLDSALLDYRTALAIQPGLDEAALGLDRLQARGMRVLK